MPIELEADYLGLAASHFSALVQQLIERTFQSGALARLTRTFNTDCDVKALTNAAKASRDAAKAALAGAVSNYERVTGKASLRQTDLTILCEPELSLKIFQSCVVFGSTNRIFIYAIELHNHDWVVIFER